ncbi:anhydro-N-acetylmuramic acid kinase [Anaerobacillus alkaliphilus]|uniref:Anhydro-N-acetylmuramic acid kinase n=1 Tax=Anaerobacillus alkaliphilus TaxID=1548597 RepID=A0A4Q0VV39_9BACI|nr:anhydro-N-acetylmuramic acid kinase [Anaerobacillus alkaliphilus]RXJ02541.1 anhydro-N-acetylmuramic acid kinase [Anaerobacillus alkaliphilus]
MIQQLQQIVQKEKKYAVGLMSGTSLDGIDAALVEISYSGENTEVQLLEFETLPYSDLERARFLSLCSPETSSVETICLANVELGKKFAQAALTVIHKAGLVTSDIDFISSHGQTIFHMPEQYATLQIGELAVIAEESGILTVGDFRPSDMAAGGQGAPLVPFVDYLLFKHKHKGRILLNIGGISNISVLKADGKSNEVIAFDTGPGNVLIDSIVIIGSKGELSFDPNGEIARSGTVCNSWLEEIINHDPFVYQQPPKSTGRELYSQEFARHLWEQGQARNMEFKDIVATVTAFTAHSIAINIKRFVDGRYETEEILVGGGGTYNDTLLAYLQALTDKKVGKMEDWNFSSDAKEAIAFAILGNEFLHGNANNLPSATGAKKQAIMGKLVFPSKEK